jgi:hypothetical protein
VGLVLSVSVQNWPLTESYQMVPSVSPVTSPAFGGRVITFQPAPVWPSSP